MPVLKDTEASLDIGCEKYAAPEMFTEGWDFPIDHMDGILELNTLLAVRLAKFELAQDDVEYCGHVVGLGKQSPAQLKARTMIDFSILRYKTQVKVLGYERQYIPMFSRKKFSLEEGGVVANVPRKWGEKGLLESRSPTFRIDSSKRTCGGPVLRVPRRERRDKRALDLLGDAMTTNMPVNFNYLCDFIDIFDNGLPVCQVIYSQFGLAIHQNDHQARRRFVEWAQNEIAVVPDFHKRILLSDEVQFLIEWLRQQTKVPHLREANPQVYVETPLHPEKLTVWCALWAGGILLQKR
ncbi:hypothetical protein TNCV_2016241 [Trichonephila clavipes]|nr:hypothetical protein TNCV_2016241 [Trichonephila clavipes]